MNNRRDFIIQSGLTATGLMLLGTACVPSGKKEEMPADSLQTTPSATPLLDRFGIQLYTLRDVLQPDPLAILSQLPGMGYSFLEGYEGPMGLWWGQEPIEFKKFLDDNGLKMASSHCACDKDLDRKAAEAAVVGLEYLICPWIGPQKTLDDFKRVTETFNTWAETCKKEGIRFAYHNHEYSFVELEGQLPQDVMMTGSDPSMVDFEMDMYWVVTAGQDPIEWMKKYPGRFKLCHVKDRDKNAGADVRDASVTLGTGRIDYTAILPRAKEEGMAHFIVEQEKYEGTTPMDCVRDGASFLKNLTVSLS